MKNYVLYNTATGEITQKGTCQKIDTWPVAGLAMLEDISDSHAPELTHYVDLTGTPTITPKVAVPYSIDTTSIPADGVTVATISGLPTSPGPIDVTYPDGHVESVTSGSTTFGIDLAGSWTLTLSSPIHLDTLIVIEAT